MFQTEFMYKQWRKAEERLLKFFKAHPRYNATAHLLIGVGLGILMTHEMADPHPLRWGLSFLALGTVVHLYPVLQK